MTEEVKHIKTKKVFRYILGGIVVLLCLSTLVAANIYQSKQYVSGLNVSIINHKEHEFVKKSEVEQQIFKVSNDLKQIKLSAVNVEKLEQAIKTNPWVVSADVFLDNQRQIQVEIQQAMPVARIFDQEGTSYFLDEDLNLLPVNHHYAYAAPVFTNIPLGKADSINKMWLGKIKLISNFLQKHDFWNAQITQIEVRSQKGFVAIPLIGAHEIVIGDTDRLEEKMENLMAFYKEVNEKVGWNVYKLLDTRFKDQIVASPGIGYVPPRIVDTILPVWTLDSSKNEMNEKEVAVVNNNTKETTTTLNKEAVIAQSKNEEEKKVTAAIKETAKGKKEPVSGLKENQDVKNKDKKQAPKYIYKG